MRFSSDRPVSPSSSLAVLFVVAAHSVDQQICPARRCCRTSIGSLDPASRCCAGREEPRRQPPKSELNGVRLRSEPRRQPLREVRQLREQVEQSTRATLRLLSTTLEWPLPPVARWERGSSSPSRTRISGSARSASASAPSNHGVRVGGKNDPEKLAGRIRSRARPRSSWIRLQPARSHGPPASPTTAASRVEVEVVSRPSGSSCPASCAGTCADQVLVAASSCATRQRASEVGHAPS